MLSLFWTPPFLLKYFDLQNGNVFESWLSAPSHLLGFTCFLSVFVCSQIRRKLTVGRFSRRSEADSVVSVFSRHVFYRVPSRVMVRLFLINQL